jgi:hypothetical protein
VKGMSCRTAPLPIKGEELRAALEGTAGMTAREAVDALKRSRALNAVRQVVGCDISEGVAETIRNHIQSIDAATVPATLALGLIRVR